MTLLPEIRGQLLDAAFGAAEPKRDAPRGQWLGRLAIAISIPVSVAVAAVVLLSLHGSAKPPSGPTTGLTPGSPARPPLSWVTALGRAGQGTRQHDPACRQPSQVRVRDQRFVTTAPPRSITEILPSLASPAPGARKVTVSELRALQIDANGIYVRYAWQGYSEGIHYYVVPAAAVGAANPLPARCYREELAAFREAARHFPASQRAAAIAYAQQRFNPGAVAGVSIVTVGRGTRAATYLPVWRLAELKTNPAFGGGGGTNNSTTTSVLVTDQVASVTATYPAQSYPGRVPTTFSVTKRPIRNVVIFHLARAWDPPQLTFRSRTGAVIARTHNP